MRTRIAAFLLCLMISGAAFGLPVQAPENDQPPEIGWIEHLQQKLDDLTALVASLVTEEPVSFDSTTQTEQQASEIDPDEPPTEAGPSVTPWG